MADKVPAWEHALSLALLLPAKDRLRLAESLVASVQRELPISPEEQPDAATIESTHWGENVLALLETIGPIELEYPDIDDPVEWVKRVRQDQERGRGLAWSADE